MTAPTSSQAGLASFPRVAVLGMCSRCGTAGCDWCRGGRHRRPLHPSERTERHDAVSFARCGAPDHLYCPRCSPRLYAKIRARHRSDRP